MPNGKLTVLQQAFVDAFTGNATEACRIAGYKGNDNQLGVQGAANLRNPKIANLICSRQDEKRKPTIANREERQEFWTRILRGEALQVKDDKIETKILPSVNDMQRASELLGKSEGDFFDRLKIEGGVTIERKDEKELDEMVNELVELIGSLKQALKDDPTKGE